MTRIRADKVRGIAADLPPLDVDEDAGAELLVVGWGSSRGAIRAAARRLRANGHAVAVAHLHHVHPLPTNLGEILHRYERVLVPEMNTGQLAQILRAEYLVDVRSHTKLEGKPLFAAELERVFLEHL
jgi:2-oxoglutarate ferredoxin oxidoreductase subunit alpha